MSDESATRKSSDAGVQSDASLLDECVCAWCGSGVGEAQARLMLEFHEAFTLLVLADPGDAEYQAHLDEARRILDVQF